MRSRSAEPGAPRVSRRRWLAAAAALGVGGGAGVLWPAQASAAGPGTVGPLGVPRDGSLLHVFGTLPAAPPKRVFAAGAPAAVLLTCLAPASMLGWPWPLSDAARSLLPPVVRDKPMLGRLAGRGSTVSLDALMALKPDLVLDAGTVDETYASGARRVAEQTGLPVLLLDGRLADTPRQLRELGRLLGVVPRAEALAAEAEAALSQAAALRAGHASRPGVYLARSANGLETATAGSINAEIIEAAGGRNVAATGHAGVVQVSMEQVFGWAPDWILTQDRTFFRRAAQDAGWRTLAAVREGRVLLVPDAPFGWLDGPPGVNRMLGVRWLAASLARGRPAGPEAVDEALRLHALYYGLALPRERAQAMLDGRG